LEKITEAKGMESLNRLCHAGGTTPPKAWGASGINGDVYADGLGRSQFHFQPFGIYPAGDSAAGKAHLSGLFDRERHFIAILFHLPPGEVQALQGSDFVPSMDCT
jgi:hypothetical protein